MQLYPELKRINIGNKNIGNNNINIKERMRKILSIMALFAISLCGFAQSGKLHIEANSQYLGDTVFVLTEATYNHPTKIAVKDNKIACDLPLDKVETVAVLGKAKSGDGTARFIFLGVPGEKALITTTDASHYYINGSKFYQDFNVIDRGTENLQDVSAVKNYLLNYIKQNPKSEAPVAMFGNLDYDTMNDVYAALSPEVKNGRTKDFATEMLANAKEQKEADEMAAKKQAVGVEAPDFTLTDINGKPLTLSSLRGKYVLLDFWGSWCVWCIKGMPQMKEYYKKYPGKFEILGIDCNDTDQKWRDAVKKYELPWLHVYNPRDSKVLADYGIQGFPTKILVGPDGKIVKTIVGEDPSFYTFLDETFGK